MLRKLMAISTIVIFGSLALTACAGDVSSPAHAVSTSGAAASEPPWLTTGSAADEYQATISAIGKPLPSGVAYPPGLPPGFVAGDAHLGKGAARNVAEFTWLCAWETEYTMALTKRDADRQAAAESMISEWATMDFYQNVIVDPGHEWVVTVLNPLKLGDPKGLQQEVRNTCPLYPTVTAN